MRIIDRIENALRNKAGGLSVAQLVEEIQKTESHIRKELSNGKAQNRFVVLGNGNYANRSWEEDEIWQKL